MVGVGWFEDAILGWKTEGCLGSDVVVFGCFFGGFQKRHFVSAG